jgi:hypothetical protein
MPREWKITSGSLGQKNCDLKAPSRSAYSVGIIGVFRITKHLRRLSWKNTEVGRYGVMARESSERIIVEKSSDPLGEGRVTQIVVYSTASLASLWHRAE